MIVLESLCFVATRVILLLAKNILTLQLMQVKSFGLLYVNWFLECLSEAIVI